MSDEQRINMDIDKKLWKKVGMKALELDAKKKEIVEKALKEFLEKH